MCKKLGFTSEAADPQQNFETGGSSGSTHCKLGLTQRLLREWASGDLPDKNTGLL